MNDLLAQAIAEVLLIAGFTEVRKRQQENCVAADQRRMRRPLRNDTFGRLEDWSIATLRQFNHRFVRLALLAIVTRQLCPQAPGLNAHNRIASLVESRAFAENFDANHELFQTLA